MDVRSSTKLKIGKRVKGNTYARVVPVTCYGRDGKFVKTYPSLSEAARKTNILVTSINNAIKGRSKLAGGFKWEIKL